MLVSNAAVPVGTGRRARNVVAGRSTNGLKQLACSAGLKLAWVNST